MGLDPIPQNSLDQCKRCDRRGVRAQNTRSQGNSSHHWPPQESRPLLLGKPALRADQDPQAAAADRRAARRAATGSRTSVSSSQKTSKRSASVPTCSSVTGLATSGTQRTPHCSAASIALARMRSEIDTRHLRVSGHNGLQTRGAHFHSLLDEIVEPCMLERCEQEMQVAGPRLRALLHPNN